MVKRFQQKIKIMTSTILLPVHTATKVLGGIITVIDQT